VRPEDLGGWPRCTRRRSASSTAGPTTVPSASISYVVDPTLRGRAHCTRMIIELMRQPELAEIRLFGAGVEPDNLAFIGSLVSAGLEALDARPDWEGMVYYVKRIAPG